jgi:hypothetical protein
MTTTIKIYSIHLVTATSTGVAIADLGTHRGNTAFTAAKRAAGRGAKFVRSGQDMGYRGPNGMAWMA